MLCLIGDLLYRHGCIGWDELIISLSVGVPTMTVYLMCQSIAYGLLAKLYIFSSLKKLLKKCM